MKVGWSSVLSVTGRSPNSATMAIMLRKVMTREKALALGRELPDPRVITLEQEAAGGGGRVSEVKAALDSGDSKLVKLRT